VHQPKAPDETGRRVRFYVALGLVTAAALMLQVIETRIISVTSWYHLAFFVISIAMFGLTAGAVFVYLRKERFRPERLSYDLAVATLAFALTTDLAILVQLTLVTGASPSLTSLVAWAEFALCLAFPFFFSGVVVSLALTRSPYPIGATRRQDRFNRSGSCIPIRKWRERQFLATIAGLIGIAPQDEIESMIAAQLIAAHNATMECYRRAMIGEQTLEGRRDNLSQANKLSRTYAVLLDALNRHRGKGGQQKVTVEHVHVHAGGQAVVGTVETPASVNSRNSENQHNARQITHAPQPTMPSLDPPREPLPVASNAKRPLPDARRNVDGSTKGK